MPSGIHQVELDLSIEQIWDFVKDMNKWAPLVPGYITHEILTEKQSTWEFKGDIGIMKKKVRLQIDIKEWIEPSTVTFDLKGLNENFGGDGYFKAEIINENKTLMTGSLDITASGKMGPMINVILKKFVPQTATELTDAIAAKIQEVNGINV
ncbi:CoxG family protein [Bacillus massiliigorillae]|uniref:CoxG family protein n=1 Tax=Bacillus massiliigorillae TaxID=1243664 RepID=UPI0003A7E8E7|nr:SRPBCC family protein [Bacillus massiliigorillae]